VVEPRLRWSSPVETWFRWSSPVETPVMLWDLDRLDHR
jgi:hypothetical protein